MKKTLIALNMVMVVIILTFIILHNIGIDIDTLKCLLYLSFIEILLFLFTSIYLSNSIRLKIYKSLKIYLLLWTLLLLVITIIEALSGWIFIPYLSYRLIIHTTLIYPFVIALFLKVTTGNNKKLNMITYSVSSFILIIFMFVNGLFILLTKNDKQKLTFSENDNEVYVITVDALFTNHRSLYLKENAFFAKKLTGNKSWLSEYDFEYKDISKYDYQWISDSILEVSGGEIEGSYLYYYEH